MGTPSDYSAAEDRANVISAALPLVATLVYLPFLFAISQARDTLAGAIVFGAALLLMYLTSTLYHALPVSRARDMARVIDHSAIFILIAGTYTPFTLGPLWEHNGLALLIAEWVLVVVGIIFKVCGGVRYRRISTGIYAGMGWLGIFWLPAFIASVTWSGFGWILAGGLFYTGGLYFYAQKGKPHTHLIWHLFVFAGSCCHAFAVWRYA